MKKWLLRTQIRQRPMLAVYGGLLVLIAVVIAVMVMSWLGSQSDDRLAVIGNLLSFGTLLLALVAGIVALAAYSAATGLPDLKLQLSLSAAVNDAVITVPREGEMTVNANIASLAVKNTSTYSARTPAVIVKFHGAAIWLDEYSASTGWTAIERHAGSNIFALQWDGGPDYAIHGNSIRHLPDLNLQGLAEQVNPEDEKAVVVKPVMTIRLLADGYSRREIELPLYFFPTLKWRGVPLRFMTAPDWL